MNNILIKQLHSRARFEGLDNIQRLALKTGISDERIRAIYEGAESTVIELKKLSIALEYNFYELVSLSEGEKRNPLLQHAILEALQKRDSEYIVSLFVTGRIIEFNNELYYSNIHGKIRNKISDNTVCKIFDLLLSDGYVEIVKMHTSSTLYLKIKSLKDLERYGEDVMDKYLFGLSKVSLGKEILSLVNLPNYFLKIFDALSIQEKSYLLEKIKIFLEERNSIVKKYLKKGAKLTRFSDNLFLSFDKNSVMISQIDLSSITDFKQTTGKINNLQNELFELVKEEC